MERAAAAVLLTRGKGQDLEVYLVERSPQLRFFGGYHALPGGVRSAVDGNDDAEGDLQPLRRCALRELFEETGVMLDSAIAKVPGLPRARLRTDLLDVGKEDSSTANEAWTEWLSHGSSDHGLRELCRVKTPPFAPVRYDTVFFLATLPDGEQPTIIPGELVGGAFVRPAEVLDRWRAGELLIVPPVVLLLSSLVGRELGAFERHAKDIAEDYRHGRLHRVQFTPGVVLASIRTPTFPPATTTNCYLVGHDRLMVIDPGSPYADEQERLAALIEELLEEGARLDSILLTHHHPDHVGGVNALSRHFDLPVRGHPLTLSRLDAGFLPGAPIQDGDRIALGQAPDGSPDWHLTAVFTPGHDRGHLCFRESRYEATMVGDMLSTVSTILIDPPEGHLQTYMNSLERLLGEPMRTLYPAHGPAIPDGHALIRKYIRHRNQRQTNLERALRQAGSATTAELLPKVYWDVDEKMYGIAARSLLAGLQWMQERGQARPDGDTWHCTMPDEPRA